MSSLHCMLHICLTLQEFQHDLIDIDFMCNEDVLLTHAKVPKHPGVVNDQHVVDAASAQTSLLYKPTHKPQLPVRCACTSLLLQ